MLILILLMGFTVHADDVGVYSQRDLRALKLRCFNTAMEDLVLTQKATGCRGRIKSVTIAYPDGFRHELDFTDNGRGVPFESVRLPLLKNTKCLASLNVDIQTSGGACDRSDLFSLQARKSKSL